MWHVSAQSFGGGECDAGETATIKGLWSHHAPHSATSVSFSKNTVFSVLGQHLFITTLLAIINTWFYLH